MPSYYKRPPRPIHRIGKLDKENIQSDILNLVSGYGGQEIISGPPMQDMIEDLTTRALEYLEWQREENEQP